MHHTGAACPGHFFPSAHIVLELPQAVLLHLFRSQIQAESPDQWQTDVLQKPSLALGDICGVPVAVHGHRHLVFFFQVPLQEELLDDESSPPLVQTEGLAAVSEVRTLEGQAENRGPVLGQFLVVVLQGLCPGAEPAQHLEVLGHVGVQYHLDYLLAAVRPLPRLQLVEDVALRVVQQLVQHRAVHVLQNTDVVVPERQFVLTRHQEAIGYPRVADVVAQGGDHRRHTFQRLHRRLQTRVKDKIVHTVENVRRVLRVVVGVLVVVLDRAYEFDVLKESVVDLGGNPQEIRDLPFVVEVLADY